MSCTRLQRAWHTDCKMIKYISKIILASSSPRRIKMLQDLGVELRTVNPDVEENVHLSLSPGQLVMSLALKKALYVEAQIAKNGENLNEALLIAADTVVYAGGVIGKPQTKDDAFQILSFLRGKPHKVYSGVCLLGTEKNLRHVFFRETTVFFKNYTDEDIHQYISSGEPMDKAGAYAIQGGFAPYIDHIEGDMDNVIGLPLIGIQEELESFGIKIQ